MQDYPDRYEPIRRAHEALASANRTLDQPQRGPVDVEPVANWHGCSSTQAMSTSQFDQWCRDGKPALVERNVPPVEHLVPKAKVADMIRAAIAQERATAQASLEAAVAIIGEETGRNEKALRADFAAQLDELRTEIRNLQRGGDDIVELPNWRTSYVEH